MYMYSVFECVFMRNGHNFIWNIYSLLMNAVLLLFVPEFSYKDIFIATFWHYVIIAHYYFSY